MTDRSGLYKGRHYPTYVEEVKETQARRGLRGR